MCNNITYAVVAMFKNAYNNFLTTVMKTSRINSLVGWREVSAAQRHMSFAQRQASLPHQPVPALQQTLHKYLVSIKPLLTDQEYKRSVQIVEDFGKPGGIGEKLQQKLQERAKNTDNWLASWWLSYAYLEYRDPAPIYVNPAIILPGDVHTNDKDFVRYVSKFVLGLVDYKKILDADKLPAEIFRDDVLCMDQYYRVLNTCRTPYPKHDSTATYADNKCIVVLCNNNFFTVRVLDNNGKPLTADSIASQLEQVISQSQKAGIPVGLLTSDDRDTWARVYKDLVADDINKSIMDQIQRSLFIVCLDNSVPFRSDRMSALMNNIHHGTSSALNSGNRWFDKTLQIIATKDGQLGANYEHSTAEAGPVVAMLDHALAFSKSSKFDVIESVSQSASLSPAKLEFRLTPAIQKAIIESGKKFDSLIENLELYGWTFNHFGKDFVKSQKLSPDAFVQVSLQLAYYRLHGRVTATYETGSLRRFLYGRTDTIRSCSAASHDYCQAMVNGKTSFAERALLLRKAIEAHSKYTEEVINGRGIDRHLLGLKLTAIESGEAIPELFKDPAFSESCHWRLSTSQISSQFRLVAGFGPVVSDGYGLCYNIMKDSINFSTSTWRNCQETDANKLRRYLEQTLIDGRDLLLLAPSSRL